MVRRMLWMCLGCVVLLGTSGCRESRAGAAVLCHNGDAGVFVPQREWPPQDTEAQQEHPQCPPAAMIADGVTVVTVPPRLPLSVNRHLVVPKMDGLRTIGTRLQAFAHLEAGEDHEDVDAERFIWEAADPDLFIIRPVGDAQQSQVDLWATQDVFDRGGARPPETRIVACVENPCSSDPYCGPCEPRVCSDAITVIGAVNLEGRWRITSDLLPFRFVARVRQEGDRLRTVADDIEAGVAGREAWFTHGTLGFFGEIAPTRDRVDGVTDDLSGERDDVSLGRWSAERVIE